MPTWRPPKGTKVVFRFERLKPGAAERFCELFGLRYKEYGFYERNIDDPRWPAMIAEVDRLRAASQLSWSSCWLVEPKPKATDPHSWFQMCAPAREYRSDDKARPNEHFADSDWGKVVSPGLWRFIGEQGWTGLESMPIVTGQSHAPTTWREVYATQPLSRGLDHPLADVRHLEHVIRLTRGDHDVNRVGEDTVRTKDIRTDVAIDHDLTNALLFVCWDKFFRIEGTTRFVREYLPKADFAYNAWAPHEEASQSGPGRPRGLCCNAAVRRALIDAGFMRPTHFGTHPTVAEADVEPWVEILDRRPFPMPPPRYTRDEARAELARRNEALRGTDVASVRAGARAGARFGTVKQARSFLEAFASRWIPASNDEGFEKILRAKSFERLPEAWRELVGLIPTEVDAPSPAQGSCDPWFQFRMRVPVRNTTTSPERQEDPDESPSRKDIVIGETPFGDWFSIRTSDPALPRDARVTWWDHETLLPVDEWPSVLAFISHLVDLIETMAVSEGRHDQT